MQQPDLLTPEQAGEIVGFHGATMRRWAVAGKVRHVRLPSGKIRFRREDLADVFEIVEPETAAS